MTAIAGEGTGMERDYDISSVRHASDLDSPEKIGRTAGERAIERLNPRKVTTRKVPVVFDKRVASTLVSHLASAVNGASIARKSSFLKDKMGEKLFADGIRIIDDPLRVRGLRSHPFDGEGVRTLGWYHERFARQQGAWRFAWHHFDLFYYGKSDLSDPITPWVEYGPPPAFPGPDAPTPERLD
jgi:hypothetical protein